MSKSSPVPKKALEVYKLVIYSGVIPTQASIAKQLKIDQPTVSRILKYLQTGEYISEQLPRSRPSFYIKGRYSDRLDTELRREGSEQLCNNIALCDAPKTSSHIVDVETPKNSPYDSENILKGHRICFQSKVQTSGDITTLSVPTPEGTKKKVAFLRRCNDSKGFHQWSGNIAFHENAYKITYRETMMRPGENLVQFEKRNNSHLLIWLPDICVGVTEEDEGNGAGIAKALRDKAERMGLDVVNFIRKYGGWKLSDPDWNQWKPHLAMQSDARVGQLANHATVISNDGLVTTSNSEGCPELEINDAFDPEKMDALITQVNAHVYIKQFRDIAKVWPSMMEAFVPLMNAVPNLVIAQSQTTQAMMGMTANIDTIANNLGQVIELFKLDSEKNLVVAKKSSIEQPHGEEQYQSRPVDKWDYSYR